MSTIRILLLTVNPRIRETELFAYLNLLEDVSIDVVQGFSPKDLGCRDGCRGHGFQKKLTCIEYAIAEGHKKSRVTARERGGSLFLFLEDDAIPNIDLTSLKNFFNYLLSGAFRERFDGVHLFPEQNGVLLNGTKTRLLRSLSLPDYAVAYVLSARGLWALRDFDDIESKTVADWPKEIRKLKWWATPFSVFIHPDIKLAGVRSSTKLSRSSRNASVSFFSKLGNPRNYLKYILPMLRILGENFGNFPIESSSLRTVVLNFRSKNSEIEWS